MVVTNFGKYMFLSFVSNWITLKELGRLDTSHSCKDFRGDFLHYIQNSQIVFGDQDFVNCSTSYDILKNRNSVHFHSWLNLRNVNICSLFLSNVNILSAFEYLKDSLHIVKKLFVSISQSCVLTQLEELVANCAKLEEFYCFTGEIDSHSLIQVLSESCPNLKVIVFHCHLDLNLYGNLLEFGKNCPALESVDIRGHLNDECIKNLCENCPKLRTIELEGSHMVSDVGIRTLCLVSELSVINAVHDGNWGISSEALEDLIGSNHLQMDTIRVNFQSEIRAPQFMSLVMKTQPNLTIINLSHATQITDETISLLCSSCALISDLGIDRCPKLTVWGAGLTIANKLVHLRRVSFHQSKSVTNKAMFCVFANRFQLFLGIDLCSYVIEGIPFEDHFSIAPEDLSDYSSKNITSSAWFENICGVILMPKCRPLRILIITEFHFNFATSFNQLIWSCEELKVLSVRSINITYIAEPSLNRSCCRRCYHSTMDGWFRSEKNCIRDDCMADFYDSNLVIIALRCPNLERLDVGKRRRLTDAGMIQLTVGCINLTSLDYRNCSNLGDATLCAVAKNCRLLRELRVDQCFVSDIGIIDLALGCSKLLYFSKELTKGEVTREYIEFLVECCPDLQNIMSSVGEYSYTPEKGVYFQLGDIDD
jgi:hypothetical protein